MAHGQVEEEPQRLMSTSECMGNWSTSCACCYEFYSRFLRQLTMFSSLLYVMKSRCRSPRFDCREREPVPNSTRTYCNYSSCKQLGVNPPHHSNALSLVDHQHSTSLISPSHSLF